MFSSKSLNNSYNHDSSGAHSMILGSSFLKGSSLGGPEGHSDFMIGYEMTREFKSEKDRLLKKFKEGQEHLQHENAKIREALVEIRDDALRILRTASETEDYYSALYRIISRVKDIGDEETKLPSPVKKNSIREA